MHSFERISKQRIVEINEFYGSLKKADFSFHEHEAVERNVEKKKTGVFLFAEKEHFLYLQN